MGLQSTRSPRNKSLQYPEVVLAKPQMVWDWTKGNGDKKNIISIYLLEEMTWGTTYWAHRSWPMRHTPEPFNLFWGRAVLLEKLQLANPVCYQCGTWRWPYIHETCVTWCSCQDQAQQLYVYIYIYISKRTLLMATISSKDPPKDNWRLHHAHEFYSKMSASHHAPVLINGQGS